MSRKLEDLPISVDCHAPSGRGSVCIPITSCISCEQPDPAKITVVAETRENIAHSLLDGDGKQGTVYSLKCDECNHEYKLGILEAKAPTPSGETGIHSVFVSDLGTGNRWAWLGYF